MGATRGTPYPPAQPESRVGRWGRRRGGEDAPVGEAAEEGGVAVALPKDLEHRQRHPLLGRGLPHPVSPSHARIPHALTPGIFPDCFALPKK